MDGSSPDELRKRKREINAALAETKREIKEAKRRVKNEQRKEETHWKLSTVLAHTLLIITQLADTPAGVKHLINFGKRRHWPEKKQRRMFRGQSWSSFSKLMMRSSRLYRTGRIPRTQMQ